MKVISQPLATRTQRHRTERHGKPQVMRKRSVKMVNDKAVVVYEWVPVPTTGYERKVAAGPTSKHGERQAAIKRAPQPVKGGKK